MKYLSKGAIFLEENQAVFPESRSCQSFGMNNDEAL
jgi:hypothetical protein